jgi:hypothetical protein
MNLTWPVKDQSPPNHNMVSGQVRYKAIIYQIEIYESQNFGKGMINR